MNVEHRVREGLRSYAESFEPAQDSWGHVEERLARRSGRRWPRLVLGTGAVAAVLVAVIVFASLRDDRAVRVPVGDEAAVPLADPAAPRAEGRFKAEGLGRSPVYVLREGEVRGERYRLLTYQDVQGLTCFFFQGDVYDWMASEDNPLCKEPHLRPGEVLASAGGGGGPGLLDVSFGIAAPEARRLRLVADDGRVAEVPILRAGSAPVRVWATFLGVQFVQAATVKVVLGADGGEIWRSPGGPPPPACREADLAAEAAFDPIGDGGMRGGALLASSTSCLLQHLTVDIVDRRGALLVRSEEAGKRPEPASPADAPAAPVRVAALIAPGRGVRVTGDWRNQCDGGVPPYQVRVILPDGAGVVSSKNSVARGPSCAEPGRPPTYSWGLEPES